MKEKIEKRLQLLKKEFESGQQMLSELTTKQENLQNTLLRISGAIQALEDLKAETNSENNRVVSSELIEQTH